MKLLKIILLVLILGLVAGPCWAVTWYGCAGSKNINSVSSGTTSDVWYSEAACTGGSWLDWNTGPHDGDIFEANAQTALAITSDPLGTHDTGAGKKVHLKTLSGGGFTLATDANITVSADITAGTTTCVTVSGSTITTNPVQIGVSGATITGGGSSGATGVTDTHTTIAVNVVSNIVAGSNATAYGYSFTGNSGSLAVTGNVTSGASIGLRVAGTGSSTTITGDCTGSNTADYAGCVAVNAGSITVTGNLISQNRAMGGEGSIRWTPTAPSNGVTGHYFKADGGGTDVYAGINTNDATKALTTFYYINQTNGASTQGSATSGGSGGAWGF